jgi:hypothetical protein
LNASLLLQNAIFINPVQGGAKVRRIEISLQQIYLTEQVPTKSTSNESSDNSRGGLFQKMLKISTSGVDTGLKTFLERIDYVRKLLGRNSVPCTA